MKTPANSTYVALTLIGIREFLQTRLWLLPFFLMIGSLVLVIPASAALSNIKLNAPLTSGTDVQSHFQISPDSSRVVYLTEQNLDGSNELYSTPSDGSGSSAKLNGPLTPGGDVSQFQISPDSSQVIYLADQDTDEVGELYRVSVDGSTGPIKFNIPLVSGGTIFYFKISPDGSRIVYYARQDNNRVAELYSIPLNGSSSPVKLNGPLVPGGEISIDDLSPLEISLDSSRVVYRADQDTNDMFELYSVPLDGSSSPIKLNGPLVSGGNTFTYLISPDSRRVVYVAYQDTTQALELYSVPLDGSSSPVKLSSPGSNVLAFEGFQISPDSSWVVYQADRRGEVMVELYRSPLNGSSSPVKLNEPLVPGGDVADSLFGPDFYISSDNQWVVYLADQETDEVRELYSVPLDRSSSPGKLNAPLVSGGDVVQGSFQISLDSQQVVYIADQEIDEVYELYSVPLNRSHGPVKLNGPLTPSGDVQGGSFGAGFHISPNNSRVIYLADQDTNELYELYSVLIDGSRSSFFKLNKPLVFGGDVKVYFQISQDNSRVIYRADQDIDEVIELYATFGTPELIFLPTILKKAVTAPDLIVERITATTNNVEVIIKNIGGAPVTDAFWVDVYIKPNPAPTQVNQTWPDLAEQGLAWGVTTPITANGGTLTLTINDAYFFPNYSNFSIPLSAGTSVYVQVDSVNFETNYGAVLEAHEITGGVYNNIAGTHSTPESTNIRAPILRDKPAGSGGHLPQRK